jgi:hypothetical protein
MRKLLILSALCLGGYFAYEHWFTEPPQPQLPPQPVLAPAKKVSLGIKRSVRSLLDEWKRRKLTPHVQKATAIVPERELAEIRKALFSDGAHSEQAFIEAVTSALRELGVSQAEIGQIAGEIVALRSE